MKARVAVDSYIIASESASNPSRVGSGYWDPPHLVARCLSSFDASNKWRRELGLLKLILLHEFVADKVDFSFTV